MNRSTPGLPVHHQLPEFTQTHVHRVSDAIQPSHPLSSPSPPAPNPSQHLYIKWASLVAQLVKKYACNARDQVRSWVGKIPWSRAWQPTPVFLPGESPGTEEPCRLVRVCVVDGWGQGYGGQLSWCGLMWVHSLLKAKAGSWEGLGAGGEGDNRG